MKIRKIIAITALTLLVITLMPSVLTMLLFKGMKDTVEQGQEIVKTSLGDVFVLRYATSNFPDLDTNVDVFDVNKKRLGSYLLHDQSFVKPEINVQIDSKSLRCYQLSKGLLIYRFNEGAFKGISKSQFDDEFPELIKSELIDLGKVLVSKNEWKWIEFFGKFLMKADDSEIKKTLERYSLGQFTQDELDLNKDSEIKKEDMQAFAKQVLEQK